MIYLLILFIYFSVFTTQNYFYCCWGRATDFKNELPKSILNYRDQQLSARVKDEQSMSSTATEVTYELPRSTRPNWPWTSYKGQQQAYEVNNKLQRSTTSYQVHKKSFYEICFWKNTIPFWQSPLLLVQASFYSYSYFIYIDKKYSNQKY